MADVIDFTKYKDELANEPGKLEKWLKNIGVDRTLIDFATNRQKELFDENKSIGEYNYEIAFPPQINEEERHLLCSQIQSKVSQIIEKSIACNMKLIGLLLLAEIKLFQYERELK
jgi:hypothetical protein